MGNHIVDSGTFLPIEDEIYVENYFGNNSENDYYIYLFKKYNHTYSYIKCLYVNDHKIFILHYILYMKNKYTGIITKNFISRNISKETSKEISKEISREISREISTGCILVSDWNEIMKSCDNYFKYRYNVFRSSFWGENAGIPLR